QTRETARYFDHAVRDCQRMSAPPAAGPPRTAAWRGPRASDVEPEVQYVALLDPVFLALQAQAPGLARAGLAAVADEVLVGDGLGADEALLEVGVDHRGRLGRGGAGLHGPGADLLHPGGEVGLQAQQPVGGPDHAVETGLVQAVAGQQLVAVGVVE